MTTAPTPGGSPVRRFRDRVVGAVAAIRAPRDAARSPSPGRRERLPIVLSPAAAPIAAVTYLGVAAAVHPLLLVRPLAVGVLVSLLITVALTLVLRDKHRAGVLAWALISGLLANDVRLAGLIWAIAGVILVLALRHRHLAWRRGPRFSAALAIFGGALVAVTLVRGVQTDGVQAAADELAYDMALPPPAADHEPGLPDIYVLLLDAFPGETAADSTGSLDGLTLADELRQRGFDVAPDARSNYLTTRLALPSIFAASHLAGLGAIGAPATREDEARALRRITDDGVALRVLAEAGYERIAVASGYGEVGPVRVDRLIVPPQLNEVEIAILWSTGVRDVLRTVTPGFLAADKRDRIVETFDVAGDLAAEPHERPRFVFVHVPAPHAPWVTDADGNLVSIGLDEMLGVPTPTDHHLDERRRRFLDFSRYTEGLTLASIDRIIATSATPPVIAVFSDHGPDYDFDNDDPLGSDLELRTSSLMAILAPGQPDLIPDDATPVNLFPYIFNAYLDTDLPIQPNTIWAWPTGSSILDFVEVDPTTWQARVRR